MNNILKNTLRALFIISIVLISASYGYESQKGKIDMHGGKGDALTSGNIFGLASGIGAVLNKKDSDNTKEKDEKNFIKIEKIEEIENKDVK